MLILVPILLVPLLAAAAGPKLSTGGTAAPASTIIVRGSGFRPDDRVQLTWDGLDEGMPTAITSRTGRFTVKVEIAATATLGHHRIDATIVNRAVRGKVDGETAVAGVEVIVARPTPSPSPSAQTPDARLLPPPDAPISESPGASPLLASGDPILSETKKGPERGTSRPKGPKAPVQGSTPSAAESPTATAPPPTATPVPAVTSQPASRPQPPVAGGALYVATNGNDGNSGAADSPFRTIARGLEAIGPGSTLYVRGGTYVENIQNPRIAQGAPNAPIMFAAYPGERPVIQGLLWLKDANYWILDGINVTWQPGNSAGDHMVKMAGGVGWVIRNAEFWGAHSYAGLLIANQPSNWAVVNNCIHDTYASNDTNQDHNIYVNTGLAAGPGLIERNVLFNAANGRNIKLGGSSTGSGEGSVNVTIRSNTLANASQGISLSGFSSNNLIEWNLVANAREQLIRGYQLSGSGNVVRNNYGSGASVLIQTDGAAGLIDAGGNILGNAGLGAAGCGGFVPSDPTASGFGRWR